VKLLTRRGQAEEGKVNEMKDILDVKPFVEGSAAKSREMAAVDQAVTQHEAEITLDDNHESWWSIIRFWIQELRWRRAYWEKMRRPLKEENDS
jgi:hypothetical protein